MLALALPLLHTIHALLLVLKHGGATICYSTDGLTTPACNASALCSAGLTYSTPVTVSATLTLKALACLSGNSPSLVTSGTYTIVPPGLTFVNGDGKAEMTGVPTMDFQSITGSIGGTINVTVPVDTDTGYVLVKFQDRASTVATGVVPITLTPGTAQNGLAAVIIPAGKFSAGAFVYVYVMMGISNVDLLTNVTGTIYEIVMGSVAITYNKKFVVTNNTGLPTDTGVTATRLTIN
ncbi:MAG: chitobiase/beta-hexosaminidase C-terminal domain-containing protein [Spirochaetia bacterium]|nr:chitobiase/beta-hexosaminidase C-terminal domain-containing protein [Spirochaetia bacterium]